MGTLKLLLLSVVVVHPHMSLQLRAGQEALVAMFAMIVLLSVAVHPPNMIAQVTPPLKAGPALVTHKQLLFLFAPMGDHVLLYHPDLLKALATFLARVRP